MLNGHTLGYSPNVWTKPVEGNPDKISIREKLGKSKKREGNPSGRTRKHYWTNIQRKPRERETERNYMLGNLAHNCSRQRFFCEDGPAEELQPAVCCCPKFSPCSGKRMADHGILGYPTFSDETRSAFEMIHSKPAPLGLKSWAHLKRKEHFKHNDTWEYMRQW